MLYLYLIILCGLSGVLGRLGGKGGHWWANTKMRDFGVPACMLVAVLVKGVTAPWWVHFFSFGLMFGACTTYWDRLFGYDNFWFHGFVMGLAYVLYYIVTGHWILFAIRCIIIAIWMGGWSKFWKKDWVEEGGRYATLPLTVFLM